MRKIILLVIALCLLATLAFAQTLPPGCQRIDLGKVAPDSAGLIRVPGAFKSLEVGKIYGGGVFATGAGGSSSVTPLTTAFGIGVVTPPPSFQDVLVTSSVEFGKSPDHDTGVTKYEMLACIIAPPAPVTSPRIIRDLEAVDLFGWLEDVPTPVKM